MNYTIIPYCKISAWKQDGFSMEITEDSSLVINADGDLMIFNPLQFPGNFYLVSTGNVTWQYSMKYIFTNYVDFREEITIDFSKNWTKKQYIKEYMPKFERILEQIKVRIEQDNVKKLLDNI